MGGKPKQVDPATAQKASAGADAAAQASAELSRQQAEIQKDMYGRLFGDGKTNMGAVGGFLDPNKLNVTQPTGPYALQYNQARGVLAQDQSNQRAQLARAMANRGFGADSPNGISADLNRKLALGQSANMGSLFSDYTTKSYNDALQNFWNAAGVASGTNQTATGAALQGQAQAGQTYDNLYSTAGKQAQGSSWLNSLIGAGGMIGSAFLMK